jgi:alkanesulfonate monooxygenase SsuD/methylene tetrahydromethanopterin reductase-like flavin-dependent oxidoreductase (luciferase family)
VIKLGLGLSVQHSPGDSQAERFREHLEQVRLARAVGFDVIFASQHYLSHPFTYFQPFPTLGRIAAEAEGMTIGTGILLLPLHQPVDVAEQVATLDVISSGRFIFGVGLGYRDAETEAMGLNPKERVSRYVEALEVVERLWSGEPVTYEGKHFHLKDVRISMPTLQRPRPPIWMAANGDVAVRRAARMGDAWFINPHSTLATIERQWALFRCERAALGRPVGEVPLIRECYLAADAATAFAEAQPYLEPKYEAYRGWDQDKALPEGESFDLSFEALARDRFLIGDPASVADELLRYRERLGVTTLVVRAQWPGLPHERVLRTIRLLGERVRPRLGI